jgi:hypothetical protein
MRSLIEIADLLEEAAIGLQQIAEGIAGPESASNAGAQYFTAEGEPFFLIDLGNDIRGHAEKQQ